MRRVLQAAASVELISLAVLLANLATAHWPAVSSLVGPLHGCAYLLVVLTTARDRNAGARTKALALIPGIGGLLVMRRLARAGVA
ncbi:hypothetical protein Pth03_62420 [Planotetraspora thailandica]|uniref:DUF3817 domain-containing protein n=1 Tax=Planotetraspora thailandica TaxID=487172 RepID=A0A8J3V5Q0_9ACTN|nr:hypothetical protein [Planotetraspora thailandica]GII57853.1 hypothetical protein Pth03_62420 [Planotetraspora thailandica]